MSSKNDKVRKIDLTPQVTGGGALITQEVVVAPPSIGTLPAPDNLVLVSQVIARSAQTPEVAVSLAWDAPLNTTPQYYIVEYDTSSDFDVNPQRQRANQDSATIFVATATQYYFRVQAVYQSIVSDWSNTLDVLTIDDPTVPPDVDNEAAAFHNSNLVITFEKPVNETYKDAKIEIWNSAHSIKYRTFYTGGEQFIWPAEDNLNATSQVGVTSVKVDIYSRSWNNVLSAGVQVSATAPIPDTPTSITSNWISDNGTAHQDLIISWLAADNAAFYDISMDGHDYTTTDLRLSYRFDQNKNDHVPTLASGDPSISYVLKSRDKLRQVSIPASGTLVNNAPPSGVLSVQALGGFNTIGAFVTLSSGVLDFDHYEWSVLSGVTTIQTLTSTTPDVIFSTLISGTYTVNVKAVDKFNQKSAAAVSSSVTIDALTIDELRADAYYIDSLGTARATLDAFKDTLDVSTPTNPYVLYNVNGWSYIEMNRPLLDRYKTVTFSVRNIGTEQKIAFSFDDDKGNVSYFAGPITITSAGSNLLTAYASLALAQSNAINITSPASLTTRYDIPNIVEARKVRLYMHDLGDGGLRVYEYYPRRLIQTDDLDVEAVRAINISVGAVTADKISVVSLAAVTTVTGTLVVNSGGYVRSGQTAYDTGTGFYIGNDSGTPKFSIGNASGDKLTWNGTVLAVTGQFNLSGVATIGTSGGLYQGSGSFASPTTGLKLFNSGGVGKLSAYNGGVEQIKIDTDGKFYGGAGAVKIDSSGISLTATTSYLDENAIKFYGSGFSTLKSTLEAYDDGTDNQIYVNARSVTSRNSRGYVLSQAPSGKVAASYLYAQQGFTTAIIRAGVDASGNADVLVTTDLNVSGGINLGSITGAAAGQLYTSDAIVINYNDAVTNAISNVFYIRHDSSGTPAAGFGSRARFELESSTTPDTLAAHIETTWATATHASRKARQTFNIQDTATREAIRIEASGSAAMIGFLGAAAIARPAVTGSRGGNAALASLLTALANLGLVTDSSS